MTPTPLPPPGVNIAAGNWTAVTDCRYYTADQMQAYATAARADLEAENAELKRKLAEASNTLCIGGQMISAIAHALENTK